MDEKQNKNNSRSRLDKHRSKQQKKDQRKSSHSKLRAIKRSDRIEYERNKKDIPFYKKIMNVFLKNTEEQLQNEELKTEKKELAQRRTDKYKLEKRGQKNKSFSTFKK